MLLGPLDRINILVEGVDILLPSTRGWKSQRQKNVKLCVNGRIQMDAVILAISADATGNPMLIV